MDDPSLGQFCCQNPRCVACGARGAGNLTVCGRIGKNRQIRLLYCRTCKKRFSERKGTVFYCSHLPRRKVIDILAHVQEGCGMRQTARMLHTKEDTVIRYVRKAGRHAQALHAELAAFSPSDPRTPAG